MPGLRNPGNDRQRHGGVNREEPPRPCQQDVCADVRFMVRMHRVGVIALRLVLVVMHELESWSVHDIAQQTEGCRTINIRTSARIPADAVDLPLFDMTRAGSSQCIHRRLPQMT
jgi:hypothetical protein